MYQYTVDCSSCGVIYRFIVNKRVTVKKCYHCGSGNITVQSNRLLTLFTRDDDSILIGSIRVIGIWDGKLRIYPEALMRAGFNGFIKLKHNNEVILYAVDSVSKTFRRIN